MGKKLNTEAVGSELKKNLYFIASRALCFSVHNFPAMYESVLILPGSGTARGALLSEERTPPMEPGNANVPLPSENNGKPRTTETELVPLVRLSLPTSQVARVVAVAFLTAAIVLGGLFLLWQVHTFIGWFVAAIFLAAVLNPAVNWLQRRHRMVKRSLAILLTYLGVVVLLVLIAGVFAPLVIQELRDLIDFIVSVGQAGGLQEYLKGVADQYGLGSVFDRLSSLTSDLPSKLGDLAKSFVLHVGPLAIGVADFLVTGVTILTLTFFMLLGSERLVNGAVRLFPEPQRPLVRNILGQSGGAVSGYISGNLLISFIAGITTFIWLEVLGVPYAAALALLVAVLDLIPLVGATLGAVVVIAVAFFVEPWKALVLLVWFLIYQNVIEGSILQPLVYSRAVHLDALTIFVAVLVGALLLGIPGALLAIPVAEIIRIVVTDVLAYRRARRGEEEEEEPAVSPASLQPPPA
jgi:predicted PurR-regulated permease PerM